MNVDWGKRDNFNVLICVLLTFCVFFNALLNGFVNWDDPANFLNHPIISSDLGLWSSLQEIFSATVIGNYNPLSTASFLIDKALFGFENEWGWHLINVLLHLGNVALVYLISRKIGLSSIGALVVALLFGIHPMRVESVAWVTERKDVLYSLFYLLSINEYLKHDETKIQKSLVLMILYFLLALFSKIQAVSLPLTLLAIDYLLKGDFKVNDFISKWYLFLMSLVVGLLGIFYLGENQSLNVAYKGISGFDNVVLAGYSLLIYLYKIIIPYPLSPYYQHPESLASVHYLGVLAILAIALLLYFSYRKNKRWLFFSFAFFIVNIFFVLQWVKAGQGYLADRFTYMPYLGLFLGIGFWIDQKVNQKLPIFVKVGLGVVLLYFSTLTVFQNQVWKNGATLWTKSIQTNRESARSYAARGNYFFKNGLNAKALDDYNKAASLRNSDMIKANRAKLIISTSRAVDDLKVALDDLISIEKKTSEMYLNISVIQSMLGNNQGAVSNYNEGERQFPNDFNFPLNRGRILQSLGRYDEAKRDFLKAQNLQPNDFQSYFELGRLARNLNQSNESLNALDRAIELNPQYCSSFYERSLLFAQSGQVEAARKDLQRAIDLNCENIDQSYRKQLGL